MDSIQERFLTVENVHIPMFTSALFSNTFFSLISNVADVKTDGPVGLGVRLERELLVMATSSKNLGLSWTNTE